MHRRLATTFAALGAGAALLLGACGSDDDSATDTTTPAATTAAETSTTAGGGSTESTAADTTDSTANTTETPSGDPFKVRVTTLSLCTEIPHWADMQGFFESENIEVEFVPATGGAAGLDAVEAGAADIAFANPVAILKANDAGRDLTIVAGSGVSDANNNGVIVKADNAADSPAGLAGQTIGINEIGGLGWAMTRAWIAADGGDPEEAEFVALGFPELVPAVEGGQVDAAQITGPQTAAAHDNPALKVLGNPFFEVVGPIPTAFYAAKSSFVEENADGMERWARAYQAAAADFDDPANRDAQFAAMSGICKTEPAQLAKVPYSNQSPTVDLAGFQKELDLLMDAGVVDEGKVAEDLVAPFAQG